MPIRVGGVIISLGLDGKKFESGMKSASAILDSSVVKMNRRMAAAEKTFDRAERAVGKFVSRNLSLQNVVATLAGTAGLGLLVKRGLDAAAAIDDGAKAAGIGTTTYQELGYAARQGGMSVQQLDVALQSFNRRMGLAADGNKTYQKAWYDMGVALTDGSGKLRSTEAVLEDTLRALAGVKDQSTQAARASIVFGDDAGKKLPLLLDKGIDGLDRMRTRAHELGIVLSEQTIEKSTTAGDRLADLSDLINTQLATAVGNNAEAIAQLATAVAQNLPKLIGWTRQLLEFVGVVDADPLTQIDERLKDLRERQAYLERSKPFVYQSQLDEVARQIAAAEGARQLIVDYQKRSAPALGGGRADKDGRGTPTFEGAEAAAARKRLEDFIGKLPFANSQAITGTHAEMDREFWQELTEGNRAYLDQIQEGQKRHQEYQAALAAEGEALTQQLEPKARLAATEARLKELYAANAIGLGTYRTAMEDARRETLLWSDTLEGGLARALEQGESSLSRLNWFSRDVFGQMGNAAEQFVNDLINEFWRLNVLKPLFGGIFNALGAGTDGGGIFASLLNFGGARAMGGPVSAGTAYLVGERGPEPFIPAQDGYVLPNAALAGLGGGMTVHQEIHNHFDVSLSGVDDRIRQATPRIAQAAAEGVRNAQQRTNQGYF